MKKSDSYESFVSMKEIRIKIDRFDSIFIFFVEIREREQTNEAEKKEKEFKTCRIEEHS